MIHRQPSQPSSDWTSQTATERNPSDSNAGKGRSKRRSDRRSKRTQKRRLMMEGLENRQLLAAGGIIPSSPALDEYEGPRNVGTVAAFPVAEVESRGEFGENDFTNANDSQFLPLGNAAGKRDTIDVTGTAGFTSASSTSFETDIDVYRFDLEAGDILDIASLGGTTSFTVYGQARLDSSGNAITYPGEVPVFGSRASIWYGADTPEDTYPANSPLQTLGNAHFAQVIPQTGTYYVEVAAQSTNVDYTLGLRTYRPVTESLPVGQSQKLYLDFDGGSFNIDRFNIIAGGDGNLPIGGVYRVPSLQQTLFGQGIQVNATEYENLIRSIVANVESHFNAVGADGFNGDYDSTGTPGDFGIEILNSLDDNDPGSDPNVTRLAIGGTEAIFNFVLPVNGVAESVDIGNFDLRETGVLLLDNLRATANSFQRSPALSEFDAFAASIAATASHEAGHLFGLRHTDNANLTANLMDSGGNLQTILDSRVGTGPDQILGTTDDVQVKFATDIFAPAEGIFGVNYTGHAAAFSLSTGTVGSGATGRIFNDVNGNGTFTGDSGLGGVTVFLDVNGDGVLSPSDPSTVTAADGTYSLFGASGSYNVIAMTPSNFVATTPVSRSVTLGSSSTLPSFGFRQVLSDVTGRKFEDVNENGVYDPGEPGVEGAYIYADLDGDNRPDLGEPFALTDEDGLYTLDLPEVNYSYAIREVAEAGFEATVPLSGEYIVTPGSGPADGFNFGGRSSRDFGDAPDSYGTLSASNGASHGILSGLTLGATVDRESDGQPTADATGDGADEDGIQFTGPLVPGTTSSIQVTVNNTTGGQAYLQGWIDVDGSGTFDSDERFITNQALATGVSSVPLTLPSFTLPASGLLDTFARFRLSQDTNISATGFVDTGEVEDYAVRLLNNGDLANDDSVSVPRNSQGFPIDVLANDFNSASNPLTITTQGTAATQGVVTISAGAAGQQQLLYTPPNNFVGQDTIQYRVTDTQGNVATATVSVNVTFQTEDPIALDDIYRIPANANSSGGFPLNVLDNDIASNAPGGLTLASVTNGTAGGTVVLTQNNQSVRYTPAAGFTGSEQFMYTVQDSENNFSTATVTVSINPDADADDLASFTLEILDEVNDTPRPTLQQGDIFRLRVSVDDLRNLPGQTPQGLASAFLDVLYSSELVTTVDTNASDAFPFDITFGPKFETPGSFQLGNSLTPGLLDEIGAAQSISNLSSVNGPGDDVASHTGPAELFTVTLQAIGSGIAVFQADPSDAAVSETILIEQSSALGFGEIRYGSVEVAIAPAGPNFPSALDDSFPQGLDSNGSLITSVSESKLDVLDNDLLGTSGEVISFEINQGAANGVALVRDNGTPNDPTDDYIGYTADIGFSGFDSFTYVTTVSSPTFGIVTSIAEVTLVVGANQDPLAEFDFELVDESGNPISTVAVGQRFGVRIIADDLTQRDPYPVFAGFLDVLYDAGRIVPSDTISVDDFGFDVEFADEFNSSAAVGVNTRAGLIDEFGSLRSDTGQPATGVSPLLATLYFEAVAPGTATITGSPADRFPFQDTLLDDRDERVDPSQIVYDSLSFTITGSGEPLQNTNLPADVNGDNLVTAIDALLVINELSRLDSAVAGEPGSANSSLYYHDVNGDRRVSAIDALRVINYLNEVSAGESIAAAGESISTGIQTLSSEASDQAIGDLAAESKVTGGAASATNASSNGAVVVDNSTADSDDDDLLDLLADDVAGLWG
ncbi:Ig-like domain-containing protein [Rhodopirellula sp. P2]|uniref:Ig-like domain-containing protein n=1 Tax=Rhodopirellula sp. P2 TaxID=2127060 RepID=UPI002367868A|nr:Ig-like domain-containing protein [Rhodopirellula sp. P2]WDQ16595.1 Ig-like domain-containing protein [Rhodopirellula sp. P2]